MSGDFTEMALQELQWRFPKEYPQVIPAENAAPLAVFAEYREVFDLSVFTEEPTWSAVYEEQMMEIERLGNGAGVVDELG